MPAASDRRKPPQEQQHDRHHQTDRDEQRALNVGDAGADRLRAVGQHGDVDALRDPLLQRGQQRLDGVHRLDDVGARLLEDDEDHRRLAVVPAGGQTVEHAALDFRHVAEPHDRAVFRRHHDAAIIPRRVELIVGRDGDALSVAVERAGRGLHIGVGDDVRDLIEPKPHRGEARGIEFDADRRLRRAGDHDIADARHLRNPLRDNGVGRVEDRAGRHGVRGERENEHGRAGGVGLAKGRQNRQIRRQVRHGGVDRRLHVARRRVDAAFNVELRGDLRHAERAYRGQFVEAGDVGQPPFERRGDRGRHGFGIGAGARGGDADDRKIDGRKARDGQKKISHRADQEQREREQRRADRPPDERRGDAHSAASLRSGRDPGAAAKASSSSSSSGAPASRARSRSTAR